MLKAAKMAISCQSVVFSRGMEDYSFLNND